MRRKKQRSDSRYSQHTINIADEHWNFIEDEAQKRGISKSKFIAGLIQQHREGGYVKIKHLEKWFSEGEYNKNWGTHMWICQNFLDVSYFTGTDLHLKWLKMRPYITKENLQTLLSESNKYHETFRDYIMSKESFTSYEIYYKGAIEELADPNGCFNDVETTDRIRVLEKMQHYIKEYSRKFNIRVTEAPTRLHFQVYGDSKRYWAYIWGSYVYVDTDDRTIIKGLFHEFDRHWNNCTIRGTDVVNLLDEVIKKIKDGV